MSGSLSFYSLFVEMERFGIKPGDPAAVLIDAIINPPDEEECSATGTPSEPGT